MGLSIPFGFFNLIHWPGPLSLATTYGVSVDVLSSWYLDVSVPKVRFLILCIQIKILKMSGFPHSEIHGSKGVRPSPRLIAAYYVLHRFFLPRHSRIALIYFNDYRDWETDRKSTRLNSSH